MSSSDQKLRVLSLDGGPSPLVLIRVLRRVEARYPGFLSRVNLFNGTSDGALIGLYLAKALEEGRSGADAIDGCIAYVEEYARAVCPDKTGMLRFATGLGPLIDGRAFKAAIERHLGGMRLGDLKKHQVSILAFDAAQWTQTTFHAFAPGGDPELSLVDVAMATSALPGLMPIFRGSRNAGGSGTGGEAQARRSHALLDGALVANTPSMAALADGLLMLCPDGGYFMSTARAQLAEITMMSLGSGPAPVEQDAQRRGLFGLLSRALHVDEVFKQPAGGADQLSWGWLQWFLFRPAYLPQLMLTASANYEERHCRQLLGVDQYCRYAPPIDELRIALLGPFGDADKLFARLERQAEELWNLELAKLAALGAAPRFDDAWPVMLWWIENRWMKLAPVAAMSVGAAAVA